MQTIAIPPEKKEGFLPPAKEKKKKLFWGESTSIPAEESKDAKRARTPFFSRGLRRLGEAAENSILQDREGMNMGVENRRDTKEPSL